ncbi:MAG TPA: EsaB/YukD family protein, partial [Micromonosporaceae bacterium]
GERLAERGAGTGWVVRRGDGIVLSGDQTLHDQGVRDGDVLHLVQADEVWPELEYDDLAEAIAATRRDGAGWNREATRRTGIGVGVTALLLALAAIVREDSHPMAALVCGAIAAILFGAGVIVARALSDGRAGVALTATGIPYAFASGLLTRGGRPYAMDLLVACALVALLAWLGALAVGRTTAVFDALGSAGVLGAVTAALDRLIGPVDTASIVLALIALAAGTVPAVAVRIGGVGDLGVDALASAVRRSDAAVVGLCGGSAIVAAAASGVLGVAGLLWPRLLTLAVAVALALRARSYGSVRQRLAALSVAAAATVPLLVSALWTSTGTESAALVVALAIAGGLAIMASTAIRTSTTRLAAWLEALSLLAILPLLAGALNLYAKARALR